ncbi:MAG: hypothetical protein ACTS2F_02060 [Thainema sp.]
MHHLLNPDAFGHSEAKCHISLAKGWSHAVFSISFNPSKFFSEWLICDRAQSNGADRDFCTGTSELNVKPLWVGLNSWPGFDVALYGSDAGIFEQRGLEVEFVRFDVAQDTVRALLRGSLDACLSRCGILCRPIRESIIRLSLWQPTYRMVPMALWPKPALLWWLS